MDHETQHLLESETTSQIEQSAPTTDQQLVPEKEGTLKVSQGIFNLVNTIIGSGFLTLPYNLMLNGWLGGTIEMTAFCILTALSCFQLIDISTETHCYQYYAIARRLFQSQSWGIVISLIMMIQTGGSLISYSIVIQQNFFWWTRENDFLYIQLTLWAFMLLIIFPLASLQKLDFLHWTSYITIFVVVYITGVTVYYFFSDSFDAQPPVIYHMDMKSLTSLPLFQNAFCCHYQIANIYRDLKNKTPQKMRKIVVTNVSIVYTLYAIVALFGYFTFTSDLRSNLLDVFAHYAGQKWYLHAANVAMLFCMASHYPLPCFGLRRTIESLFWKDTDAPKLYRILIALTIIVIATLVGSFVKEIHSVLDYTSSLAGSCVVFIFPALFSYKLWRERGGKLRLCGAIGGLITGGFVMVMGLVSTIVGQVNAK
ncbi:Amino_acid transporter system N2 [Hexamita inflata]|uniref:Putative n=1 Tax=Hexamita inflata TaxID=28002 RepID=A0AA86V106_9EUKA|nr:Amino acid transporter system N2 [Hexamita inflata]CAI9976344.1 Amino acid transporter system N2 [Hexamita inflata]